MTTLSFCAALVLLQDTGEVDRIMLRFNQLREKIQSQADYLQLAVETRRDLKRYLDDHVQGPEAARAVFHVAETYLWGNDFATGLEKLRAYGATYPDSRDAPTASFLIGQTLARNEDGAGARTALLEFIKSYPKDERVPQARSLIAVTLQNEKRYDEAAEILREIREAYKDRKESWAADLQRAVVYHLQERNKEAEKVLFEVVRGCPDLSQVEFARNLGEKYGRVGQDAPAFLARDLNEDLISLDKERGRVVIVYFFDSTAPGASAEVLSLKRTMQALEGKPVRVLGVSLNLARKPVVEFRELHKIPWPIFFDGRGSEGNLARRYGVRGLPSLTVIDKRGKIRFFNTAGRDLENAVSKLLEEG
jgi:peroxiredoxin